MKHRFWIKMFLGVIKFGFVKKKQIRQQKFTHYQILVLGRVLRILKNPIYRADIVRYL